MLRRFAGSRPTMLPPSARAPGARHGQSSRYLNWTMSLVLGAEGPVSRSNSDLGIAARSPSDPQFDPQSRGPFGTRLPSRLDKPLSEEVHEIRVFEAELGLRIEPVLAEIGHDLVADYVL